MNDRINEHIIVIFGASGDLAKYKLLPSIYNIFRKNRLNGKQLVLGAGRSHISDKDFRAIIAKELQLNFPEELESINTFCRNLFFQTLDTSDESDYIKIKDRLSSLQVKYNIKDNVLFYLSTPPKLYHKIPECLAKFGLNNEKNGYKRIIIEKPFGNSKRTAKDLNTHLLNFYKESQLFRIDHYLGKEAVQNILVLRFANSIFESLWNANYIDNIQIYANENIGIVNRGGYYDGVGAIKDMVQNHMLQLLCFTTMDKPVSLSSDDLRNEFIKVLKSISHMDDDMMAKNIVVGQYLGTSSQLSYLDEKNVNKNSTTETYVAMRLFINNSRWQGMPIYIRTGKRLAEKTTEIVVNFKDKDNNQLFLSNAKNNQLIIRIQPDERIQLKIVGKELGSGFKINPIEMSFSSKDTINLKGASAYERLITDALLGDNTWFVRDDAVEAAWGIIDPISDFLHRKGEEFLTYYDTGSHGPQEADALLSEYGHKWVNPSN